MKIRIQDFKLVLLIITLSSSVLTGCSNTLKDESLGSKASIQESNSKKLELTVNNTKNSDSASIWKSINANQNSVTLCYKLGLSNNSQMKGIIISNFTIETDGRVNNAKLKSSDLEDKNTEDCILETINSWKFEPLQKAGIKFDMYPFWGYT